MAARRVTVDLGLEPGSRSATFPMREAPEGSLGDGASATIGWPTTWSFSELRQASLPAAAGAHELTERNSDEDDLELGRAEHTGDLRKRFVDPSLVFPEGPIAAGSGDGGPQCKSNLAAQGGELSLTNFSSRRRAAPAGVPVAAGLNDCDVLSDALGRPPSTRTVKVRSVLTGQVDTLFVVPALAGDGGPAGRLGFGPYSLGSADAGGSRGVVSGGRLVTESSAEDGVGWCSRSYTASSSLEGIGATDVNVSVVDRNALVSLGAALFGGAGTLVARNLAGDSGFRGPRDGDGIPMARRNQNRFQELLVHVLEVHPNLHPGRVPRLSRRWQGADRVEGILEALRLASGSNVAICPNAKLGVETLRQR